MNSRFRSIAVTSIVASYAFYFFEWLFLVTKPSMFNAMSAWDGLQVLLIAPIPLIACCLLLIFFLWLFSKLASRIIAPSFISALSLLIPSFIIATTLFLLIENFTYTVFGFNVGSFHGSARYIYALLFTTLTFLSFRYLRRFLQKTSRIEHQRVFVLPALIVTSLSILAAIHQFEAGASASAEKQNVGPSKLPNILILSTDGLIAERMSAYGYYRDTTPFIDSSLEHALVFENSFANAERTTGSVASLLSGKMPTTTRVMMRPDAFHGEDTFVHLPGTLQNLGYRTADISIRYYADAFDLNMKKSFDYANGRRISEEMMTSRLPLLVQLSYASALRFIDDTSERASSRLRHAFGAAEMVNPYDEIQKLEGGPSELYGSDIDRVNQLFGFMSESNKPFFAHIHLLVTHGPKFFPREQVFSVNQSQRISEDPFKDRLPLEELHQLRELNWMGDFYDDAVLDFDRYVAEIFEYLENKNGLKNTMVILTSDHGAVRSSHERLPLIIWFPNIDHTGTVKQNVQRLDVAPTILDYLGVPIPGWMEGRTLLSEDLDYLRPVFGVGVNEDDSGYVDGWWSNVRSDPPFFSIGSLSLVHCQYWYFINLENGLMTSQEVEGHTAPCSENELLTDVQARAMMVEHLLEKGFEATFLLKGEYLPSRYSGNEATSANDMLKICMERAGSSNTDQGLCFYNAGNFSDALLRFESASDTDPDNELVFNNICATQVELGRYHRAIEACRKATELRPGYKLAQNNLAWAETELENARILSKQKEDLATINMQASALNEVGESFYWLGDYQDSLRCWEKALSLEPENPANFNNVAVAMIALKRYEQAVEKLEIAVSMDPDKALYRNNIAWAKSLMANQN